MKTIVLAIAVVRKEDSFLLRKKPDGSPPYPQTWYLFGGEINAEDRDPEKVLKRVVKEQAGIDIRMIEQIGWDTETKKDHEGKLAFYIYLDCLCEYVSGELVAGEGIEKVEWAPEHKLPEYDLVPPTKKLFHKMKIQTSKAEVWKK